MKAINLSMKSSGELGSYKVVVVLEVLCGNISHVIVEIFLLM